MKTYKQINKELYNRIYDMHGALIKFQQENELRRQIIEDNKLFDPIEYQRIWKKLSIAVDGLEAIKMLSFSIEKEDKQDMVNTIAKEVLAQIGDPFLKV